MLINYDRLAPAESSNAFSGLFNRSTGPTRIAIIRNDLADGE
jgi:hypothetical protein